MVNDLTPSYLYYQVIVILMKYKVGITRHPELYAKSEKKVFDDVDTEPRMIVCPLLNQTITFRDCLIYKEKINN